MSRTVTSRYDVAEHLRTPEEMAAYFEACLEEADGDELHQDQREAHEEDGHERHGRPAPAATAGGPSSSPSPRSFPRTMPPGATPPLWTPPGKPGCEPISLNTNC